MEYDDGYGKKRPSDDPYGGGERNKRAHFDSSEKPFAIKMLVSNKDAGTVIGRGGATISAMQTKSGSRIRVSNNNEYYPGTMDRVVMVTGPAGDAVVSGCHLIITEVYCNSESAQQNNGGDQTITLNLLIPNAAAGLVIGKGGDNIRKMVEESGASKIQLSAKDKQVPGIEERLITCIGTVAQISKAAELIILKICEDAQVKFMNLTTNYKASSGLVPPGGGFGRPGGFPPAPYGGGGGYDSYGAAPSMGGGFRAPEPSYGGSAPYSPYGAAPPLFSDYGQSPYGGGGFPAPHAGYGAVPHHSGYENGGGGMGSYGSGGGGGGGHGGGGAPGSVTYTIQVADSVVPAILGRAGAVIKEMMDMSGANIKVSQKGEFAPGTTNRIVTITGTQSAASHAHTLVSAKIPPM